MPRYLAAIVVFGLCTAPLSAELKVTSKMTARQVPGAPAGNDMMAAMIGPMMSQLYGGPEGVEMTITLHEDGRMRSDYPKGFAGMPAGAAIIVRPDGTSVGFDANAKTWWKMENPMANPQAAAMLAQMKPEVTTKRTGEFAEIAGLKAERVAMTMVMPIPLPPEAAQLPAEALAMIPKDIRLDGDQWVAPVHTKYTKTMMKVLMQGPMAGMGFEKFMGDFQGLTVRQLMRMSIMAGWEIETLVSKVVEEDVPDSVFDVPAGYKEIPMPTPIR
jgi:hypothetical protein